VEFAVDNVQTLKQRKAKLQAQQRATRDDQTYVRRQSDEISVPDAHPKKGTPKKGKPEVMKLPRQMYIRTKGIPKKGNPEVMIDQ